MDCYTGDRGSIPTHGDSLGKWMNLRLGQPMPCEGNWVVSPKCWRDIDLYSVYNCENGLSASYNSTIYIHTYKWKTKGPSIFTWQGKTTTSDIAIWRYVFNPRTHPPNITSKVKSLKKYTLNPVPDIYLRFLRLCHPFLLLLCLLNQSGPHTTKKNPIIYKMLNFWGPEWLKFKNNIVKYGKPLTNLDLWLMVA